MSIEDLNYWSDTRVTGYGQNGVPVLYDEFGDEKELPWKNVVCPVCEGRGSHVNPAIDAGGLTAEDFAEDPDFLDDYFRGVYDVACYRCGGCNVIPDIDEARCTADELAAWRRQERELDASRACELAEMRAGA